ncbi:MAG: anti-sigma factor family protein [Gemmatimonadota bacterium]
MTESDRNEPGKGHKVEPLTCDQAIRLLALYLDGELDGRSRVERLEEHLRICQSCYSRHEFEKGLKEQLARLGREPVRPEFEKRIRNLVSRFSDTDSTG